MAYFPVFLDIKDKKIIVVGGGNIALHKIKVLQQFDANIVIISPHIHEEIINIANSNSRNIVILRREFQDDDIQNAAFVIAATDGQALNSHISAICQEQDILVNVVDVKNECTFLFPAIVKKGELVITISTGGNSPALAAKIKKEIDAAIPEYYADMIETLGEYRDYIREKVHTQEERKQVYHQLIQIASENQGQLSFQLVKQVIKNR